MIYLDNAATSYPKAPGVGDAMKHFLETAAGNPGRGAHRPARQAEQMVASARRRLAKLLGVKDASRIVFTLNATDALHIAFDGLLQPGGHVVTSSLEHNSVMRPLRQWEKRGVTVTVVPCPGGVIDPEAFQKAITSKTKLLVATHASNVTGTIQPIRALADVAHARGCLLLADAAQTAGHTAVDIPQLGADLVAFSGHKGLLGPTGTGALYVAEGVAMRPVRSGGTGIHSESETQPEEFPYRFESGTCNTAGLAGLDAALRFIEETGIETIEEEQNQLMEQLLRGLADISGVRVIGDAALPRVPLVSLTVPGADPQELAAFLDARHGIAVRAGLHCAPAAHRTLGAFPTGTLRVSPGYFNTSDDILSFLSSLQQTIKTLT